MSVEEWVSKEHLMYDQLPSLFLVAGILFFIIIFVYLYVEKRRYMIPFLLGFVLVCGWIFLIIKQNQPIFEQIAVSSPAIRDRKKNFYYYEKFDREYLSDSDKGKLEKLDFIYQKKVFSDEHDQITYLGSKDKYIYFQLNNEFFCYSKNGDTIVFSNIVKKAQLKYAAFELKNPDFQKIGFYDHLGKFPESLIIPKNLKEKMLTEELQDKKVTYFQFVE